MHFGQDVFPGWEYVLPKMFSYGGIYIGLSSSGRIQALRLRTRMKTGADSLLEAPERIYGQSRYKTAYEIAKRLTGSTGQAVLVNGDRYEEAYSDALSIAPWAAYNGVSIFYGNSAPNPLPEATARGLRELKVSRTLLTGGTAVLPEALESLVPGAVRYGGRTLYETNAAVIKNLQPNSRTVYVTTGKDFADALAGISNAWLVLTGAEESVSGLTAEQESLLKGLKGSSENAPEFHVFGGPAVVSESTLEAVKGLLER